MEILVEDAVKAGLRCPACGSANLRCGYHEWHVQNCWICDNCGFRWQEEHHGKDLLRLMEKATLSEWNNRLIWVLHVVSKPNEPLKSTKTRDGSTYKEFIEAK